MRYITQDLRKLEGKLVLVPFGDIHHDTASCDQRKWEEDLTELGGWEGNGDTIAFIGCGDYVDFASPSERVAIRGGKSGYGLHETTYETLDRNAQRALDSFAASIKGKIKNPLLLTLLSGHHYFEFQSQILGEEWYARTGDEYLCSLFPGALYGGKLARIKLLFPHGLTLDIVASHGYGSARTDGARTLKRTRMPEAASGANIYLMGHDNTRMVIDKEPIYTDGAGRPFSFKQYFVGIGSYQRAYLEHPHHSYVEGLLLAPSGLGFIPFIIQPGKRRGKWHLDYRALI